MKAFLRRLACRLRGHRNAITGMNGGAPTDTWFGPVSYCRRCGADTSTAFSTTRWYPDDWHSAENAPNGTR